MWNGFFHASCSSLSVVFHEDKKHSSGCPLDTCKPQISFIFSSPFTVSLLLKDPPELHSAELLTFCSSFVFVPFVSVTEREMEFRREECEGMFVCQRRVGGLG